MAINTSRIINAMWNEDLDFLNDHAGCICCCDEHTFSGCPARVWYGCIGQGNIEEDESSWVRHYQKAHGMSEEDFYRWS